MNCPECGVAAGHKMSCSNNGWLTVGADFESHHIQGYARAAEERGWTDTSFSTDLISHIEGNLWMGGCINGLRLPDEFKYVISLYKWEAYRLGENTERYTVKMYDSADVPPENELLEIAQFVNNKVDQGQTLVHCQAGLNRSGLITALSLMLKGRSAEDAMNLLRAKRCQMVLCNEAFESWLYQYDMRRHYADELTRE